jgi:hypothetical protein
MTITDTGDDIAMGVDIATLAALADWTIEVAGKLRRARLRVNFGLPDPGFADLEKEIGAWKQASLIVADLIKRGRHG